MLGLSVDNKDNNNDNNNTQSYIRTIRVAERTKVWPLVWWFWLTWSRGVLFKFSYEHKERPAILQVKRLENSKYKRMVRKIYIQTRTFLFSYFEHL